jgi:epoxyqueuosine reductase QueG
MSRSTDQQISKKEIEGEFRRLCERVGRRGVIGFVPVEEVRLLSEQAAYLRRKLDGLGTWSDITAVSIGLLYHESEILAIPEGWVGKPPEDGRWNQYARAYTELNRLLNDIADQLAERFSGVAEGPTLEGWVEQVRHVNDYFSHCVSHRAFAEAAGVGWRGRSGLVITPEAGPALRFATVFVPQRLSLNDKHLPGCGNCRACLEVCPILRPEEGYRERCRRRLRALGLEDEVCGICVRVCWEAVRDKSANRQIANDYQQQEVEP